MIEKTTMWRRKMTPSEFTDRMRQALAHLELASSILEDLDHPQVYDICENIDVATDDLKAEIDRDDEPDYTPEYN